MPERSIRVHRAAFPGNAAYDTGVSRALLELVASGRAPESLRVHRPNDALAFSVIDARSPGFPRAVESARRGGFEPILRLAGGRAAVFHAETLAFSWTIPERDARRGVNQRFGETADLFAQALRGLGVDTRVGEVAGEYCPGAYSVNARGRRKLVGIGQRVVRGAAHVGGVVVVGGSERVRAVLDPVYEALGLDYDPETVGAVEDEVPGVTSDRVADAVLAALRSRFAIEEAPLPEEALERARSLEPNHRPGA